MKYIFFLILISLTVNLRSQTFTFEPSFSTTTGLYYSSSVLGDFDNDGDIDIISSGYSNVNFSNPLIRMYRNENQDSFVTILMTDITPIYMGEIKCADYNNDGWLDILAAGQHNANSSSIKLYKNNGNGTFTNTLNINTNGTYRNSIDWGDFDNDGRIDFSYTSINDIRIYRNTDTGFTSIPFVSGINLDHPLCRWVDYNNNGLLDLLITNATNSYIYDNDGKGSFVKNQNIIFEGISFGTNDWGDYNGDGYLDLIIGGSGITNPIIYKNNGGISFTQINTSLPFIQHGTIRWGDSDNDGDLDILLGGYAKCQIFQNEGNDSFLLDTINNFMNPISEGSALWFDYDSDGDLDIFATGHLFYNSLNDFLINCLYTNNTQVINQPPNIPNNLTHSFTEKNIKLLWTKSHDSLSLQNILSYNIKAERINQYLDIANPLSDLLSGKRKVSDIGNAGLDSFAVIIPFGYISYNDTIVWSVQSIDASFSASNFSVTDTLIVPFKIRTSNDTTIYQSDSVQIKLITNLKGSDSLITYQWFPSTGLNSDTIKNPVAKPAVSTTYIITASTPNGAFDIDSIRIEVDTTLIYHFLSLTDYNLHSDIGDYNNDGYPDILSGVGPSIYKNNGNNTFTKQTSINLGNELYGECKWVDLNNDNLLDIFYLYITPKAFLNNGNNTFTQITNLGILNFMDGSFDFGDYDNDGDNDLLIMGNSTNGIKTMVYRNNLPNNFSFTQDTNLILTNTRLGNCKLIDLDNNNFLDIFITGLVGSGSMTTTSIYKNLGNGNFANMPNIGIEGTNRTALSFADINNDGLMDVFINGTNNYGNNKTLVYINNGNFNFTLEPLFTANIPTNNFSGNIYTGASMMDFNNDGSIDLLYKVANNGKLGLFLNDSNTFIPFTSFNTGHQSVSIKIADFDKDNDPDILSGQALYRNNSFLKYSKPSKPTGLSATNDHEHVYFSWNRSNDSKTSDSSLTYNIEIRRIDGSFITATGSDSTTGTLNLCKMGNAGIDTNYLLSQKFLQPNDTLIWRVQSINNGFLSSEFTIYDTLIIKFSIKIIGNLKIFESQSTSLDLISNYKKNDSNFVITWANTTSLSQLNIRNPLASPLQSEMFYVNVISPEGSSASDSALIKVTFKQFMELLDTAIIIGSGDAYFVDFDNDNDLDIYINRTSPTLFLNNGNTHFQQKDILSLQNFYSTKSYFKDFNNDGYLDLLISGDSASKKYAKILINQMPDSLYFIQFTTIANSQYINGADFNNDGNIDLLSFGHTDIFNTFQDYYINDLSNSGSFIKDSINIPNLIYNNSYVGDFDNNSFNDFMVYGFSIFIGERTVIAKNNLPISAGFSTILSNYKNNDVVTDAADVNADGYLDILFNPNTTPSLLINTMPDSLNFQKDTNNIFDNLVNGKFLDYNNDGHLDIISTNSNAKFYKNTIGLFNLEMDTLLFEDNRNCFLSFGDFNFDGNPDLLVTYNNQQNNRCFNVYINKIKSTNHKPSTPNNIYLEVKGDTLFAKWDKSTDDLTNSNSLYYNISLKNISSNKYIMHPSADLNTGFKRLIDKGNAETDTNFIFFLTSQNLGDSLIFQIQSIDQNYHTSSFTVPIPIKYCSSNFTYFESNSICFNDSILFGGQYITNQGINIVKFNNFLGCDSSYVLFLDKTDSIKIILPFETDTVKKSDIAFAIDSILPYGGILTGNSLSGNIFNPSIANNGNNYLIYTFVDSLSGCKTQDSINIFVIDDTGISEIPTINVKIFPNPAKNLLTVTTENNIISNIKIIDQTGRLIKEINSKENSIDIDISALNDGVFGLIITDNQLNTLVKWFIKI